MKSPLRAVSATTLALCCVLSLSCGSDDPTAPGASTSTYVVQLDLSAYDRFESVTALGDGTILAGGATRTMRIDPVPTPPDTTYDHDACLIRFDAAGDTAWTTVFGEPLHSEAVTAATRAVADGYVTAGQKAPFGPASDAFVERVLETGETGWSVAIDQNGFDTPRRILTTSDGSYVMAGQASNMGGYSAASVVRVSQGGAVVWAHAFSFGDTNLSAISVEERPGGNLLVFADAYIRSEPYDALWVLELSPSGDLETTVRIPLLDGMHVVVAALLEDGGYRLVGMRSEHPRSATLHMTVDAQGAMTSSRLTYIDTSFWLRDGLFTADGGAVMCGREDDAGLLVKLDADGEIAWRRLFPIDGGEVSLNAMDAHLGGYVIAGNFGNDGATNRDMVLIRTDGDGEVD